MSTFKPELKIVNSNEHGEEMRFAQMQANSLEESQAIIEEVQCEFFTVPSEKIAGYIVVWVGNTDVDDIAEIMVSVGGIQSTKTAMMKALLESIEEGEKQEREEGE